jgi:low affinity Fe/Cu permease
MNEEDRMADPRPTRPTEVSDKRGRFDTFADRVSTVAAKPAFFVSLLVLAVAWIAVGSTTGFSHHWIDLLDVFGTIVTLLLVALLENEQWRNAKATQRKLNALLEGLAHVLSSDETASEQVKQLQAAVGLEKRESISD